MTAPAIAPAIARAPLSVQQFAIYRFCCRYIELRHASPTLHELVEHMGLRSADTARGHLEKIARKGWITFDADAERGVAIVKAPTS